MNLIRSSDFHSDEFTIEELITAAYIHFDEFLLEISMLTQMRVSFNQQFVIDSCFCSIICITFIVATSAIKVIIDHLYSILVYPIDKKLGQNVLISKIKEAYRPFLRIAIEEQIGIMQTFRYSIGCSVGACKKIKFI